MNLHCFYIFSRIRLPKEETDYLSFLASKNLFTGKNEKKLLDLLKLHPVPPDEVMLSPKLLNLRTR